MLPGTSAECRAVERLFGTQRVKLLEGQQASERNVLSAISGRRIVHLAAHGVVDQRHGNLFGAIVLSLPSSQVTAEDDGFLSLHEIYHAPLDRCELAVLSACQTNVGAEQPFEAGATLARAFLAAGSRRVIASHWGVSDDSTAELMQVFFSTVAETVDQERPIDYAAALHHARRKIRSDPRWSAPYHWAPFVLIGPAR